MAKTRRKRRGESTMGYFRQFYEANPALLKETSNEELINHWKRDHPNHTPRELKRARQNLANLKSHLRRKKHERRLAANSGGRMVSATAMASHPGRTRMEILEEHIDDCLSRAKDMDREGLALVIKHLRLARNEVVLKNG